MPPGLGAFTGRAEDAVAIGTRFSWCGGHVLGHRGAVYASDPWNTSMTLRCAKLSLRGFVFGC